MQWSGRAGPSPSAPAAVGPFPNAEEAALLTRLDPGIADHCERASPADTPRLSFFENGHLAGRPIAVKAGLACTIPSAFAPSIVYYWTTRTVGTPDPVAQADALILSDVGRLSIPNGDCATQAPAYGRWEFGGKGGRVLCRLSEGDALIEWTYDGEVLLGVAVRHDGDSKALYDWWRDNGRAIRSP